MRPVRIPTDRKDTDRPMPALSDDLWDYVPGAEERNSLPDERGRKLWDYFFRDNFHQVGRAHMEEIWRIQGEMGEVRRTMGQDFQEIARDAADQGGRCATERGRTLALRSAHAYRAALLAGIAIVLGALLVPLALHVVPRVWPAALGIYVVPAIFLLLALLKLPTLRGLARHAHTRFASEMGAIEERARNRRRVTEQAAEKTLDRLQQTTDRLAKAGRRLVQDIPAPPGDEQVDAWARDYTDTLEAEARKRLNITDEAALAREPIKILAPGKFQDAAHVAELAAGLRAKRDQHLEAFHIGEDSVARFAVYYFEAILFTQSGISIYAAFLDIITGEVFGELADEYFYEDVISVATETGYRLLNQEAETTRFTLKLVNGESVSVRLTDEARLAMVRTEARARLAKVREQYEGEIERLQAELDAATEASEEEKAGSLQGVIDQDKERLAKLPTEITLTMPPVGIPADTIALIRSQVRRRKTRHAAPPEPGVGPAPEAEAADLLLFDQADGRDQPQDADENPDDG